MLTNKLEEAQQILREFGLPESQQSKICGYTLLALAGISPNASWSNAISQSVTLTKDIMSFVNDEYGVDYKPNTRESFRKAALKPFVDNNIALLNPDDPDLPTTSSKTHYALTENALNAIKTFGTKEWDEKLAEFKANQFVANKPSEILLKDLKISNYKSISEESIELGRINVFIGVNGCGKTNILEALAMAGASLANDMNLEGLYGRGVRIARPNLTKSSFLGTPERNTIDFDFDFIGSEQENISLSLYPEHPNDVYTKWIDQKSMFDEEQIPDLILKYLNDIVGPGGTTSLTGNELIGELNNKLAAGLPHPEIKSSCRDLLKNFAIFDLNTKSLRGVVPADSRRTPLGINGEGLDLLISNFNPYEREYLQKCNFFFDWLDEIFSDKDDKAKTEGLKPGRSTSTLYFTDVFMQKQNNTFSAENSNEGILHVLFYLSCTNRLN